MTAKYTKLILIVCLLSSVLLSILGCVISANPNSKPLRSLRITMDFNQREEFFTQMRKFADKHSLEFTLSLYGSDNTIFLVAMYGDGFHITASHVPESTTEIKISFFNEASTPTPQETVDALFDDLKVFISEIPNVTISEEN